MAEKDKSIHDVYKSIGENEDLRKVVDIIKEGYFPHESEFIEWWYTHNKTLCNSPDGLCHEGEKEKKHLETILMDILNPSHGW
ncbi:MAG: hypothetical protein Q8R47_04335 [Nanoarchaeota archaeon]|nr:hypothetical protein [Nanoarchaeota archaeon]